MIEKKILEIPIYSMKENEFQKKWNNFFDKNFKGNPNYQAIKMCYFPQYVWKYNQIIGYLEITYSNNTIWFNQYCIEDRRIYVKSNKKLYMTNMQLNGYHFFIKENMNNEMIIEEILFLINSFEKDIMNKKYYFNKEEYIDILKCLDIKRLIEI